MTYKKKKSIEYKPLQVRSFITDFEVRATKDPSIAQIAGYACLTSTVDNPLPDAYYSIFTPGAFTKTINDQWKNKKNIKLLYNHDKSIPIGVLTEVREDDNGLYFEADINLKTTRGNDIYELINQGAINGVSFGFYKMKNNYEKNGLEVITEVALTEISPCPYPAQQLTSVQVEAIRSKQFDMDLTKTRDEFMTEDEKNIQKIEERAEDNQDSIADIKSEYRDGTCTDTPEFEETREETEKEEIKEEERGEFKDAYEDSVLRGFHAKHINTVEDALYEFYWSGKFEEDDAKAQVYDILNEFMASYMEHFTKFQEKFGSKRSELFTDESQRTLSEILDKSEMNFDELVRTTSLTQDDIKSLQKNEAHSVADWKLNDESIPAELRKLILDSVDENIRTLKTAMRSRLSVADTKIIDALEVRSEVKPEIEAKETLQEDEAVDDVEVRSDETEEKKEETRTEETDFMTALSNYYKNQENNK